MHYRFLCPQCGQGFAEGTAFKRCPKCQVPLLETGPAWSEELSELPDRIDLDELLRKVLADQRPGEDIDATMRRVSAHEYPDSQDALIRLVSIQIDAWQKTRRASRQKAVEELAKAQSEMVLGDQGQPEVRTELRSEIHIGGMDELSPEMRDEARRQIADMLSSGDSGRPIRLSTSINRRRIGCLVVLVAATIALAGRVLWGVVSS